MYLLTDLHDGRSLALSDVEWRQLAHVARLGGFDVRPFWGLDEPLYVRPEDAARFVVACSLVWNERISVQRTPEPKGRTRTCLEYWSGVPRRLRLIAILVHLSRTVKEEDGELGFVVMPLGEDERGSATNAAVQREPRDDDRERRLPGRNDDQ